jgi:hypothetical protein
MAASGGNFQGASRLGLTFDVFEVEEIGLRSQQRRLPIHFHRLLTFWVI